MRKITSTKKPSDSMLTLEQWESVSGRGNNILVSASAGSGKTKVLTTRVLEYLKAGKQIDELLIVTFTNAAARDMKEKISKAIQEEIQLSSDENEKSHLQNQMFKVGKSYISTIHSFCLRVIERYYYLIDFDPVFRQLTDNTEIEIIKEDVWDELFSELLTVEDKKVRKQYEEFFINYGSDRDLDVIFKLVNQLYTFAMAKPEPEKWLKELPTKYDMENGLVNSRLYKEDLKPQLLKTTSSYLNTAKDLLEEAEMAGPDLAETTKVLRDDFEKIQTFNFWIQNDQLDTAVDETLRFKFGRWKNAKDEAKEISQALQKTRETLKKNFTSFINKYFSQPISRQEEYMLETKEYISVLVDITLKFKEKYEEYKYSRQLVDFNDLEQLTIKILRTSEDEYSMAAEYYQQLFFEVMIDEYQDTNKVQEEILRLVTRQHQTINEKNNINDPSSFMFMVGDVKQSIYGFRQADPSLFQGKYLDYEQEKDGGLITLAKNFRSRNEVLQATNSIFEQIMRVETSGIPYAGKEALEYGFTKYPEDQNMTSELLLIDDNEELSEESDLLDYEKEEQVAFAMASRVQKMFADNFQIYDKKLNKKRDIRFGDIVILTRTNSAAENIKDVFQEENIPVVLSKSENFLKSIEVTTVIALLKIIDNPHQDIPFVTVLRSPIVQLNEVDLARIRIQDKQVNFYEAYLSFLEADFIDSVNIDLQNKLEQFDQLLNKWRNISHKVTVSQLIREIYQDTRYDSYVLGLSGGVQRQANLQALYERAATYEKTSFKGLFRFIRFIEKIQEKENDLIEPMIHSGSNQSVRVMTIHESKGQEFPVVILAQMERKLNQPEKKSVVLHKDLGIGMTYQNFSTHTKLKVWSRLMIEEQIRRDELEEEMRVLYVALTRAEQKLIMVGHTKNREQLLDRWDQISNRANEEGLSEVDIFQANSYLDWVGPTILTTNEELIKPIWVTLEEIEQDVEEISEKISFEEFKFDSLDSDDQTELKSELDQALKIINHQYEHQMATETVPFQTVSEIKRFFEDPDLTEYREVNISQEREGVLKRVGRYTTDSFQPPKFVRKETVHLERQELGKIVHLILQKIDIENAQDEDKLKAEFNKLKEQKIVRQEWLADMPFEKITQIFNRDFGKLIIKNKDSLRREVPFSLMRDASYEFAGFAPQQDYYLIKGIIDGYFEIADGIILFDYKTDKVSHLGENAEQTLLKRYSGQLRLYRLALETILNKKVVATKIISVDLAKVIDVH